MALGTGVHNMSLVVRAHNRASRALAGVNRDLGILDATRRKVSRGFASMASVGALAIKAIGVAVAAGIGGSILAYSKFDDSLTSSLAIVEDVSPKMRESLENTAREVAKTTIFSANEAAEAYFHLFSAGQTVEQAMANLPTVANFAQAGLFDLETATELLVTSQNALGLAFEDPIKNGREMARVADVIAAADNVAVGSIEEFSEALTNRAAAAMRTYNIDVEEGVAVLAAWATQGLKGRTAGNAFSIVTRDLQKAALSQADAWREAGAAVYDNQGNMRNMADIVGDLEDAMEGLTDAGKKQLLQDLGFQERSQQRILQLLGTSDAIREYEAAFREAGGTTQRVADNQMESAIKQLGLLKSAFIDLFIGSGKHFDEDFVGLVRGMTDFINTNGPRWVEAVGRASDKVFEWGRWLRAAWFYLLAVKNGLDPSSDKLKDFNEALGFIVETIGKVITKWNNLRQPIRDALGDWANMIPIIFLVSGGLKIIAAVMGLILSPALLVASAIAGLIILFKYLWENSETFREIIANVQEFITETVVPKLEEAWELIQEAAAIFLEWFQNEALPWLIELWGQIEDTFSAAWDFIVALWETATGIIEDLWNEWGEEIWNTIVRYWGLIQGFISNGFRIIEGIFQVFTGILTLDWSTFWEGIKNIFGGIWGNIKLSIETAWGNLKDWLGGLWDGLSERWSGLWEGFKDVVKGPLNWVLDQVEGFVNKGVDALNGLINAANHIPGVNIGNIPNFNIPRLAQGGNVVRDGLAIVGEAGPEMVRLTRGAQVTPLTPGVGSGSAAGVHIDQVIFQGTPTQMLQDYRRETKLILRGM